MLFSLFCFSLVVFNEWRDHSVVKCNELDLRMQGFITSFCKYQAKGTINIASYCVDWLSYAPHWL